MRKHLILTAILSLVAGLAYAQVGGAPGVTGPVTNPTFTGIIDATGGVFKGATPLCFDGATPGTFKTCFTFTDPAGSNKTVTWPNLSGTPLLGLATQDLGGTNATITLDLQDDDTANNFLKFTDVGTPGNSITFQQDVNGPGWQVSTTDATTTNTFVQTENSLRGYSTGNLNAAFDLNLQDDDTASNFLTFTDVGTPANIITLAQDVNTPRLTFSVASGAGTGVFALSNAAGVFGDAAANDTITIQPAAAGGAAVGFTMTTSDITGAAKTVTWADASGTPVLSSVANNAAGNANSVTMGANSIIFEGTTGADGFETTITAPDVTADQAQTLPNGTGTFRIEGEMQHTWADDLNGGTHPNWAWEPLPGLSILTCTCNDPQGCDLTIGEANAYPGMEFTVFEAASGGGGHVHVVNQAGILANKAGADLDLAAVGGAVRYCYIASTWVQCSPLL